MKKYIEIIKALGGKYEVERTTTNIYASNKEHSLALKLELNEKQYYSIITSYEIESKCQEYNQRIDALIKECNQDSRFTPTLQWKNLKTIKKILNITKSKNFDTRGKMNPRETLIKYEFKNVTLLVSGTIKRGYDEIS